MNITQRLVMIFNTDTEKKVSLTVDDPREDITEKEIKEVMQLIVSKNVFSPSNATLTEAVGAKIIVTDTTEFDLVV